MLESLEKIRGEALEALNKIQDETALENWRTSFLGRSSALMQNLKQLSSLSAEERPKVGQAANQVKQALEAAFEARKTDLSQQKLQHSLGADSLDVTLPGRAIPLGRLHPITQTMRRIAAIFAEMGFQVYHSRDVETDEYN